MGLSALSPRGGRCEHSTLLMLPSLKPGEATSTPQKVMKLLPGLG